MAFQGEQLHGLCCTKHPERPSCTLLSLGTVLRGKCNTRFFLEDKKKKSQLGLPAFPGSRSLGSGCRERWGKQGVGFIFEAGKEALCFPFPRVLLLGLGSWNSLSPAHAPADADSSSFHTPAAFTWGIPCLEGWQ